MILVIKNRLIKIFHNMCAINICCKGFQAIRWAIYLNETFVLFY